jgi:hypothetical protein
MRLRHCLQLGYATTVHKAQGATADHALLLATTSTGLELTYTALSRGRHTNQLYVATEEVSQPDHLERSLARVEQKTLALERAQPQGSRTRSSTFTRHRTLTTPTLEAVRKGCRGPPDARPIAGSVLLSSGGSSRFVR